MLCEDLEGWVQREWWKGGSRRRGYTYIHTYTHIYINTHTHIHTLKAKSFCRAATNTTL